MKLPKNVMKILLQRFDSKFFSCFYFNVWSVKLTKNSTRKWLWKNAQVNTQQIIQCVELLNLFLNNFSTKNHDKRHLKAIFFPSWRLKDNQRLSLLFFSFFQHANLIASTTTESVRESRTLTFTLSMFRNMRRVNWDIFPRQDSPCLQTAPSPTTSTRVQCLVAYVSSI